MSEFGIEDLMAAADGLAKKQAAQSGDWPNCTFVPDGSHKGRFVLDPENNLYHEVNTYGYFKNAVIVPSEDEGTPEGFVDELESVGNALKDSKVFKYARKYNFLVYFYLVETDAKNENWQPGNLYCLLGNGRLAKAFSQMVSGLAKEAPEALLQILDPKKPGRLLNLTMTSGNQGSCSIAPTMSEKTFELPDLTKLAWKPLSISYVRPGFSKEKYDKLLAAARAELAAQEQRKAAKAAAAGAAEAAKSAAAGVEGQAVSQQSSADETSEPKAEAADVVEEKVDSSTVETSTEAETTDAAASTEEDPWAKFRT